MLFPVPIAVPAQPPLNHSQFAAVPREPPLTLSVVLKPSHTPFVPLISEIPVGF